MKRSILNFLFIALPFLSFAQKDIQITLKGQVVDSVLNEALTNLSIKVYQTSEKKILQTAVTDSVGNFLIKVNNNIRYELEVSFLSFETKKIPLFFFENNSDTTINIGKIFLRQASNEMKQVDITATKPLIKQEIDRIAYNVQEDPDNKFESVLEMLKKVSLIAVDGQDRIELKGRRNFRILINGRPSSLFANDPSTALQMMAANTVERIEVITTPPSKYDADGLAGLINIVMIKKTVDGYNGTLRLARNFPYGPLGSLSTTLKNGKFGMSAFGSYFHQSQPATNFGNTINTMGQIGTHFNQGGSQRYSGESIAANGELSYEIDTLNLLTLSVGHNDYDFQQEVEQLSTLTNGSNETLESYSLEHNGEPRWASLNMDINYQLGFKRNKNQLFTVSYKFSKSTNDVLDMINISQKINYYLDSYKQKDNAGLNEHTFQADYIQPGKNLTMEAGGKVISRNNFSNYYNSINESGAVRIQNNFEYNQTDYNLYNSYHYVKNQWAFKGGVRLEATQIDEQLQFEDFDNKGNYFKIIPSVSIQYTLDKGSINFGFSQRIQRPNVSELNPFQNLSDPKIISSGNPNLRPVVANNYELSYSNFKKGSIYVSLGYSYVNNNIERVTTLLSDTVLKTTFENIGRNRNLSLNVSTSNSITDKLRLTSNGQLNYISLKGSYKDQSFQNDGFRTSLRLSMNYQIADGLRSVLSMNYTSSEIRLQGKTTSYPSVSLNVSKQLFDKRLSIFASISNPFSKFINVDNYTKSLDFYQSSYSQYYYRTFVVSLNYSFGKLKESLKKAKRGIRNDDIKPVEIKLN